MKVLFFITSSMEKPSPSWHLMKALMEDVLSSGIKIHAIQRHYEDFDGLPFPEEILQNSNFTYSLIKSKMVNKKNFIKRYVSGFIYAKKSKKYFRQNNDFDLVFVQSSPTSLFYLDVARHFAKKRPVIYNSQDMFPGSAIANGSISNKIIQKTFYKLQKIAYNKADIITAISEDMKDKLIEQGVSTEKINVIVNWYDDTSVKEISWEQNKFVEKYNLEKDKFYVQYAGTMGTNFNPDVILKVAEKLKEYPNIIFQMIGNGVRKEKFEKEACNLNLNNIKFYPLQPQEIVSDVYSACSVCIIPLKKGVIGNSVPSKAALLMACRKPIINAVDYSSDYAQMFEREKIGFSADVDDYDKISRDIIYLYENNEELIAFANRAKEYGILEYSRQVNTKKYVELFKNIVNGVINE